ncbi:MFS transporter [Rugosimonospora africana]|uniref:MFS transporter n=1 Tax=Rugosimonospora africana TaxID=556532 RepID=A0A8J3QMM8_9ACTN|nr:MFS transporter [Rugosimonospora africana]GIH12323.1 MFS transporter [Rugosimonospora africana]
MRAWFRATAGGLSATYWVIWSGILVNKAGGFATLFLSLYLTGPRQLTPGLAGTIVGGSGIGAAAGTLLGGVLADRWGRRRTLLLAHFGASGLLLVLASAHSLPVIAACVVLVGASQGMPGPAFVAAIVDITPEAARPRAFNLQFWAFNLGVAAAGLIAGAVARLSFTLLFVSDAATTLVTALLILLWVPESVPHKRSRPAVELAGGGPAGAEPASTGVTGTAPASTGATGGPSSARAGLRVALTDRIFMTFVGLALLQAVLSAQNTSILPLSMTADRVTPSGYGLLMSLTGLLIVAGQLFVPWLIRRMLNGSVLALALGLAAAGYGALAFAGSLGFYLACATVWTAGAMLAAPANATIMSDLAPPTVRARYQAVFYLTFSLASFIAPALGGLSWQYLGSWHWVLCGLVGLVACVGHLIASPARERRIARRPVTGPATRDVELIAELS